ncbi:hypothetical protein [Pontibacter sp. G13]|uniref:hypothetical protein n=1 Tax=Pontibacter sp. G13 TaxID=3074898 RepID=UPI0028898D7C|nr:hypothetical protein [Pontibacter sp. G13]WNJ20216.1 hypothetical protein RJD25_07025 [Pontibacter sp. G13]
MTYRDNEVVFQISGDYSIVEVTFQVSDFSITEGQDPDGHIYNGLIAVGASNGTLSFSIGRSASGTVADFFNKLIPSTRNTFNHGAGELNFALIGTLKLMLTGGDLGQTQETFSFGQVALAQGHSGGRNNWWFGGKNATYTGDNQVETQGRSSAKEMLTFSFLRGGNAVNGVGVTLKSSQDGSASNAQIKGTAQAS